jgi:hypothetical protein
MLRACIEGIVERAERWLGGKRKDMRAFLDELFKDDLHAKRVDALAGATLGVMTSVAGGGDDRSVAGAGSRSGDHACDQEGGRARKLRDARLTAGCHRVSAVVCVPAKGMQEPWCLAVSDAEAPTAMLVNHCARRWGIEPNFRDTKDLRFGVGLGAARIGEPPELVEGAPQPSAAHQRLCHHPAHHARRRRRGTRHGPAAQVQYRENPHPFPLPPRLHALRIDPNHARTQAHTPHATLRHNHNSVQIVQRPRLIPLRPVRQLVVAERVPWV